MQILGWIFGDKTALSEFLNLVDRFSDGSSDRSPNVIFSMFLLMFVYSWELSLLFV